MHSIKYVMIFSQHMSLNDVWDDNQDYTWCWVVHTVSKNFQKFRISIKHLVWQSRNLASFRWTESTDIRFACNNWNSFSIASIYIIKEKHFVVLLREDGQLICLWNVISKRVPVWDGQQCARFPGHARLSEAQDTFNGPPQVALYLI